MSLSDLPDDILIRLLSESSPRDVARAKRLNHRFNHIVERYNIGKPIVKEFSVESRLATTPTRPFGKLRIGNMLTAKQRRRLVVTMKREKGSKCVERVDDPGCSNDQKEFIQENMRKVVMSERLSFDGVTLDNDFYNMLTARWNDLRHVSSLSLSFCHIHLSSAQFADLLSRMSIRHMILDFCTFDSMLVSDKVLRELPYLETLKIQPRSHCCLSDLTDATLNFWAAKEQVPRTVQMYNCATRVSIDGIKSLLTTATAQTSSVPIDWDFGLLLEPAQIDNIMMSLIFSPGVHVTVQDDFRSKRVQLNNRAEKAQLSFNLFQSLPPTSYTIVGCKASKNGDKTAGLAQPNNNQVLLHINVFKGMNDPRKSEEIPRFITDAMCLMSDLYNDTELSDLITLSKSDYHINDFLLSQPIFDLHYDYNEYEDNSVEPRSLKFNQLRIFLIGLFFFLVFMYLLFDCLVYTEKSKSLVKDYLRRQEKFQKDTEKLKQMKGTNPQLEVTSPNTRNVSQISPTTINMLTPTNQISPNNVSTLPNSKNSMKKSKTSKISAPTSVG
ncbi:unnamed protein product [Caenorhabditis bovis]|uniref:F-box domain-containing protein n=1 Tax=Caenorhabditis bovis TaxID=2654633 RepID=A0A8S1EBR4_9PELO|nr:unnamed protein product [Caenorhabditis bovis]